MDARFPYHSHKWDIVQRVRNFLEWQAFGVCSAIGERLGIASSHIRLWFIYISFLTVGSPLIIYMILAFWLNMKRYIACARRNPLWYW
ncbi:MAG: PspC domain-containing protein [Thermoflavifilum sp.]|nr:PspC domain-containing protein [Thermoflavifilum sp.]